MSVVLFLAAAASAQTGSSGAAPKPRAAKTAKPAAAAPKATPAATAAKPAVVPKPVAEPAAAPAPAPVAVQPQAPPVDPNRVVMTVGEEKITAGEFDVFLQGLPEQYRTAAQGPMKRQIAEQYAQVRVMAQEARRRGLGDDPVVKSQMQFQNDNLLAGALFRQMQADTKTNDAALKAAYEAKKNDFEQIQARHILVRFKGSPVPLGKDKKDLTEEEALAKATELRKRIGAGEDFAKIAKEESDDVGSGSNGGDLGGFRHGQMVPEFEKVAFAQPIGQISEPIKTQFGYHVIKVEKHDTKSFDDARAELTPEVARQTAEALKAKANVQIDDGYFGLAQQAPVAAGPPPAGPPAGK